MYTIHLQYDKNILQTAVHILNTTVTTHKTMSNWAPSSPHLWTD